MSAFILVVFIVISVFLLANAVARFRSIFSFDGFEDFDSWKGVIFKLRGLEVFDWCMGSILTAIWVLIVLLVRN